MDAPYLVGPQFGDIQPKSSAGALSPTVYNAAGVATSTTLELGAITRVTPYSAFTEGQDIIFWLDVTNKLVGGAWVDLIRLKLWWLRPNVEFRCPGDPNQGGWLGGGSTTGTLDATTFGGTTDVNNRGVWIPETRAINIVPPAVPNYMVGQDWHDVVWMIRLQDPNTFGLTRRLVFGWKAYGRALGFSSDYTFTGGQSDPGKPTIGVSYKTGWSGGSLVSQNAVL